MMVIAEGKKVRRLFLFSANQHRDRRITVENTEMLNVRVSKELKQRLEMQAKDAGLNLSDYLRELSFLCET
jgi:predicted HicB family RNase H-like nuclease